MSVRSEPRPASLVVSAIYREEHRFEEAIPRVESMRFQTRPAGVEWRFTIVISAAGQRRNLTVTAQASQLANLGRMAGEALARIL